MKPFSSLFVRLEGFDIFQDGDLVHYKVSDQLRRIKPNYFGKKVSEFSPTIPHNILRSVYRLNQPQKGTSNANPKE